jgi:UDP-glucose 4-epimerase
MKALVTGGCGFIGSHLAEMLLALGHEVVILDNLACGRKANIKSFNNHPQLSFHQIDICDRDVLLPYFQGVDWVFHMAGLFDFEDKKNRNDLCLDDEDPGMFKIWLQPKSLLMCCL